MANRKNVLRTLGLTACLFAAALLLTCDKVDDNCGSGKPYDPLIQFCAGGEAYELCGGKTYNPINQRCMGNYIGTMCQNDSSRFVAEGESCDVSYSLNVSVVPASPDDTGGSVLIIPPKDSYNAGEQVALRTEAKEGYTFIGWSGAISDTASTVILTMDSDKTIIATFRVAGHTLTVVASPVNGGNSVSLEEPIFVTDGDVVEITATPGEGYVFDGWVVMNGEG